MVRALQGEKESVAYVAVQVREEGLPDDKERRAQLLTALYLAILFQKSDRTRALVFSALRHSYYKKHREEVMEMLKRLTVDFTRYQKHLSAGGAFTINIDKYIRKLKVLEKAFEKDLREQKDMGSVSQETAEPPMERKG
jgi:hypothetical protein